MLEDNKYNFPVAIDPRSQATLEMATKAAKTNATVLISGETGVGKELIALHIHHHSAFNHGPFVSVNCAALPENMIEAILFGYEKGAFTNAINTYPGKFEQANNGTLLLDEISELPIMLQAKLLRVLQERVVERLGGKKMLELNIRIIAATNRDLKQQIAAGYFRSDLYYRLNVVPIHCVALRDRPLDILPLAGYFLQLHANDQGRPIPKLTPAAQKKLTTYPWPGNIREMDNVIQRALIMCSGDELNETDLGIVDELSVIPHHENSLKQVETKMILDVLRETEGCRTDAAKKLNISQRTLRYKISKLKLNGLIVP